MRNALPDWSKLGGKPGPRVLELKGRIPADAVLLIDKTTFEREWSEAGRLAGFLDADRYFSATS